MFCFNFILDWHRIDYIMNNSSLCLKKEFFLVNFSLLQASLITREKISKKKNFSGNPDTKPEILEEKIKIEIHLMY